MKNILRLVSAFVTILVLIAIVILGVKVFTKAPEQPQVEENFINCSDYANYDKCYPKETAPLINPSVDVYKG